jgi:hypothetical protein
VARKAFLLRLDPRAYDALERWAQDELRSVNGQIEYLLRQALVRAGRLGDQKGDVGRHGRADRRTGGQPGL